MVRSSRARRPPPSPSPAVERPRGRPRLISDERLLEIAREVFLERGIQATTSEVATRAGVSEGTLFHRFGSKDALFRAAMRFDPEKVPDVVQGLWEQAGAEDLRGRLRLVGERMLEIGQVAVPMMMMSWSNPTGEYRLENMLDRAEGYRRTFRAVCAFFERELELRSKPQADAEVLARIFMGSLHHYCMVRLLGVTGATSPTLFVHGVVDVIMNTIDCPAQASPPSRGAKRERPKRA